MAASIQAQSDLDLVGYWSIAGPAITLYDTILTFPKEVQFIWSTKFRGMTFFYVAARSSIVLSQILYPIFWFTTLSEKRLFYLLEIFALDSNGYGHCSQRNLIGTCLRRHAFTEVPLLKLEDVIPHVFLPKGVGQEHLLSPTSLVNVTKALTMSYDLAIFAVTVYHTWGVITVRRSLPEMTGGTNLVSLILKQGGNIIFATKYTHQWILPELGIARFFVILFWGLQDTITQNRGLGGLTMPVGSCVTTILVLRFFLDLRVRNAHRNGTAQTMNLASLSSFNVVTRCIGNSIIEVLGDPEEEALFVSQATSDGNVSVQAVHPIPSEAEHTDSFPPANPL
ncbi:hypothetical protein BU17DRAFT_63862 [Hysterangium stoloniferum]|nr:hypothetical protein BU17DRAFT_63862 [Hysterangium stoloniferum]